MSIKSPIDGLADKVVARLRTIVPGVWGAIVGAVLTWLITKGWIPEVAQQWQGIIVGATTAIVVSACITAVYMAAQWIEAKTNPVSRFIARALLVVLKQPTYAPLSADGKAHVITTVERGPEAVSGRN